MTPQARATIYAATSRISSDAAIASFYGVTADDVASIRLSRPSRIDKKKAPVESEPISQWDVDQEKATIAASAALSVAILRLYARTGRQYGCDAHMGAMIAQYGYQKADAWRKAQG